MSQPIDGKQSKQDIQEDLLCGIEEDIKKFMEMTKLDFTRTIKLLDYRHEQIISNEWDKQFKKLKSQETIKNYDDKTTII